MSDLAEFLRARLDEDEATWRREQAEGSAAAKQAIVTRCERVLAAFVDPAGGAWPDVSRRERTHADATLCDLAAIHAVIDPARGLREVAAERAILSLHAGCGTGVGHCDDGGNPLDFGCHTLAYVGAIHSDHPDYRAEWAV